MSTNTIGSVTARLKGGFGNQLFQYASGRALASQLACPFFVDTQWFSKANSNRQYKLPSIGLNATNNDFTKGQRNSNKLASKFSGSKKHLTEPSGNGYQPFSCQASQRIYLDGYWQSEKYFVDIRTQLLADINLELIEKYRHATLFPSDQTVAVHIRRGDYITQDSSQALSIEYVKNAMAEFGNNHDFMFFSDDINWCKETFAGNNITFANNQSDLQDLKQMSQAAHNIIANSTFSWWSAWLNKNKNQRVIAPRPWTIENTHKDILPERWQTIAFDS
ncbi:MAG: alpha-1,2-fucosyltransferase [Granulosicoccaceae bacterium]